MPDITPPTVSMRTSVTHFATVGFTGYSNAIYITLSEPSTDFDSTDLTVVNGGGVWGFTGSGTEYKAYIYIGSASNASVSIANGKFSDAAGNFNTDGADTDNTISFTYQDVAPPYLYFANSLDYKSVDVGNSITLNITLSESSTNFDLSDINVTGGQLSNFLSVTPRNYRVTFTASDATVNLATLSVAEGAFSDAAGNFNTYRSAGTNLYKKSISIIHNHLAGSTGSETISGTERSDQITTFNGNDVVYAGEGSDVINGLPSTLSPDVYAGTLIAYGGGGNDFIFGKAGDDTLYGEDGNDVLEGGDGRDVLYGGNGNDVLSEADQLINFLYGDAGDDFLDGTGFLYGGSGNDQLTGGNIADHLEGGSGDDRIYGGDGVDTAIYAGLFSKFSVTVLYEGKEGAFSGYRVVDNSGSEGVDWISTDVEFLSFYNGKTIVTCHNGSISSITLNSSPTGSVGISGKVQQGEVLTATNTLADEDGVGALQYQWSSSSNGYSWTNLSTGLTLKTTEAEVGKFLRVTASYTDGIGTSESVTSSNSISVVNSNDAPTGSVVLDGTEKEGYVLTVSNTLADIDGLGLINYKWQSSDDGTKWADVGSGSSLQLSQAYVGKLIRAVGYYSDGHGTYESVPSQNTSSIAPLIRATMNIITVIVAPGVIGKDAVLLRDLIEVMTYKSGGLISQSIGYGGASFQYSQIDPLITVVTRNSDFTTEFTKEINDYLKREANIGYAEAITLVGVQNIDSTLLKIAGADGDFVG
jgi:Ca2+-binding RTX toxin-like protein